MKIKISTNKESPTDSLYRVGAERKDLTHREAVARLMVEKHLDQPEAESELAKLWVQHQEYAKSTEDREKEEQQAISAVYALTSVCPSLGRRLSQAAVDLLKEHIGYSSDSNGSYQWFYRMPSDGRVWDVCSNPIPAMSEKDHSRFKQFQKKWFQLHTAGRIKAWVMFDAETSELSPLMDDHELLRVLTALLPEDKQGMVSETAKRWFLEWAEEDFEPKAKPWGDVQKSPVDKLPNIRELFNPNQVNGWAANLMKDEETLQIKMPETITNKPDVDAFTYIDLGALKDGPTPSWDKWIQSVHPTCREIFMAAVFAPMHEKCRHRKLVWMRSQGYDGKSTFFNALNRFSGGKLTRSFGSHNVSSDFGLEGLLGARILLWGDSQHEHALSTNVVHNITGGDVVTVNRKHEKAIQYRFNSMLFVASNTRPQLKSWARNETTRLLYIPFIEPSEAVLKEFALTDEQGNVMRQSDGTPIFKGSNLEEELLAEMPHILFKCGQMYKKYCPEPYKDIAVPQAVYDLMLEENEHEDGNEFAAFVSKHMIFGEDLQVSCKDVHDKFKRFSSTRDKRILGELHRYLEKHYMVGKKKLGARGHQTMHYVGCALSVNGQSDTTMFDN